MGAATTSYDHLAVLCPNLRSKQSLLTAAALLRETFLSPLVEFPREGKIKKRIVAKCDMSPCVQEPNPLIFGDNFLPYWAVCDAGNPPFPHFATSGLRGQ